MSSVEVMDRIGKAVKAAGGVVALTAFRVESMVLIVHSNYVEQIDLEDGRHEISVSRYPFKDVGTIEMMIRHAKDFNAFRRNNPSLIGLEHFWEGRT